jgi:hypothetical protein
MRHRLVYIGLDGCVSGLVPLSPPPAWGGRWVETNACGAPVTAAQTCPCHTERTAQLRTPYRYG